MTTPALVRVLKPNRPGRRIRPREDRHSARRTGNLGHCSTCGKLSYTTRRLAKKALRELKHNAGRRDDPRPMREYPCAAGTGWHIGHHPKAVREGTLDYREWASKHGHIHDAADLVQQTGKTA
jgi:hypothetical protein